MSTVLDKELEEANFQRQKNKIDAHRRGETDHMAFCEDSSLSESLAAFLLEFHKLLLNPHNMHLRLVSVTCNQRSPY